MHAWPIILEPVFSFYVVTVLSHAEAKNTDVGVLCSRPVWMPLQAFEPQKRATSQGCIIRLLQCVWEIWSLHKGDPCSVFKIRVQGTRFDTETKWEEFGENFVSRLLITFADKKKDHSKVKDDVEDRTCRTQWRYEKFLQMLVKLSENYIRSILKNMSRW
jgi:hypothetical protein